MVGLLTSFLWPFHSPNTDFRVADFSGDHPDFILGGKASPSVDLLQGNHNRIAVIHLFQGLNNHASTFWKRDSSFNVHLHFHVHLHFFLLLLSLNQNREPGFAKPPLPPKDIGGLEGQQNLRSLKTASPSLRFNVALTLASPFPGPTIRQPLLVWVAPSRISVRQTGVVGERKSLPVESILKAGCALAGTGRLKTESYRIRTLKTGFHPGGISPSNAANLAKLLQPSNKKFTLDPVTVKPHLSPDLSGLVTASQQGSHGTERGPSLTGHQNSTPADAARRVPGLLMQTLAVLLVMACANVFDALPVATEHLSQEVYARATQRSPWLNIIDRSSEAPRNAGTTFTTFTTGPIEPTGQEAWAAVQLSNGSNEGACAPSYSDVNMGFTSSTYSPERFNLRGEIICRDDLTFDHNPAGFLNIYLQKLAQRAQRSWENRYQNLYAKFARKWVAQGNFGAFNDTIPSGINQTAWVDGASSGVALGEATSQLTQDMLDSVAISLIEEGATDPDESGYVTLGPDGPVYPLVIGHEASLAILRNNSALRDDLRYATQGAGVNAAPLLTRIGATRILKNFRHVVTTLPPRFTYSAGTGKYTYVAPYESYSATKGTQYRLRSAWKSAPYEGAYVTTPWVFKSRTIRPDSQVSNLSWDPKTYLGDWRWVTGAHIIDPTCETPDPFGDKGRHFAQFMHAPEPIFPTFGAFIMFKRCVSSFTTVTCT